jgi:hypothetical protein
LFDIGSAFVLLTGCGAPVETLEDELIGTEQSAVSRPANWFLKGHPLQTRKLTYCVDGSLYALTDNGEIYDPSPSKSLTRRSQRATPP